MRTILISTVISVALLALLFFFTSNFSLVLIAVLLALLEITLSLDNAVVNVKALTGMSLIWQKRFLYFGLPIAVFGMRLIFPIVMVSLTTPLSFTEVIQVAIHDPKTYSHALHDGMPLISGFGGSFLLMVFFSFFVEKFPLKNWAKLAFPLLIVLAIGVGMTASLAFRMDFFWAYLWGALINFAFHGLQVISKGLKKPQERKHLHPFLRSFISTGLLGFLYLEVLDASFSFDGVLGAFAITQNIFVIMIGLGIGALFVRSFTMWMLDNRTLQKWAYLDDGAHYAVLFLGVCILGENFYPVPEFLIAFVSVFIIGVSMLLSRIKVF